MFESVKAKLRYYRGSKVEYKIGDRVKLMPFLEVCRMGTVRYQNGVLRTRVEYPDGMSYLIEDLKLACGRTVKIIDINMSRAGAVYDVSWVGRGGDMTFRIRPYIIESKVLSIEKCEVDDLDRARIKFNAKVLEKENRKAINEKVLKGAGKFKPKKGE